VRRIIATMLLGDQDEEIRAMRKGEGRLRTGEMEIMVKVHLEGG